MCYVCPSTYKLSQKKLKRQKIIINILLVCLQLHIYFCKYVWAHYKLTADIRVSNVYSNLGYRFVS